ncbi:MAG: protein kinase, partial [Planctomycetes bacterium]|nr:protein kinase [Planctomycetota bacterium]
MPRPADILFLKIAVKRGAITATDARDLRDELDRLEGEGVHSKARTLCVELGFLDERGAKDLRREVKAYLERKAETESQSSRRVAGFEIEKRLGAGAMGVVYRARNVQTQQVVALKVLNPDLAADDHYLARFKLEAEVASSLEHPNMVQSFAVGVAGDVHYIAMEFVSGKTVKELIARRSFLQPEAVIEIGLQIADALRYAHTRNLVHRDVKPANIMVTKQGQAKLLDLGLARKADAANGLTGEGKAIGTPYYMAPEAALDKGTDYRADLYSFGVTLFTMATGERPFEASTPVGVMNKHLKAPIPDAHKVREGVPPGLSRVIKKLMAKRPAERYQDHDMLRRDLEAILAGRQPMLKIGKPPPGVEFIQGRPKKTDDSSSRSSRGGAKGDTPSSRTRHAPPKKRFPWLMAAAAAGLLAGGGALTLLARPTSTEGAEVAAHEEPEGRGATREAAAQQARSEAPRSGRARARALEEVARQFPNTVAGERARAEAKQILDELFALDREHFDSRAQALESLAAGDDVERARAGFLDLAGELEDPDLADRAYARAQELERAQAQRLEAAEQEAQRLVDAGREREAALALRAT